MHKDLPKKPDLLIVSDTPMWQVNGENLAFEPVIREIESFYPIFNKITWIGFKYDDIQDSAVALENAKVNFIMLDNIGGSGLANRIKIYWKLPRYFFKIWKEIGQHDLVHARGPSIPALFVLIISLFKRKPTYWYKYAGNWDLANPPFSYKTQKIFLRKNGLVTGTINGKWPDQPKHLLSFENPCFTNQELGVAKAVAKQKTFNEDLKIVFVGRIEELKGFDRLLTALSSFKQNDGIEKVFFVGGGVKREAFSQEAEKLLKINYEFTGPLKRDELNKIYAECHIFILPSLSEGFPKVLAESAAFGCVPVVSDLSCIGQYFVEKQNGMLLKEISPEEIREKLQYLLTNRNELSSMSKAANQITDKFTYEYYNDRIKRQIIGD